VRSLSEPARNVVGMTADSPLPVELAPWSDAGFEVLQKSNTPEMTEHLGGPESQEKLADRHRRYLDPEENGTMFLVVLPDGQVAGSTGFWEHEWDGEPAFETGYAILPGFQGRGLAVAATLAAAEAARADGRHRWLYAFPSVEHTASNAVCRKAGFELRGESEFEYPKGHFIRSNVWRLDLSAL